MLPLSKGGGCAEHLHSEQRSGASLVDLASFFCHTQWWSNMSGNRFCASLICIDVKGYSSGYLRKGRERKSFISFVRIFVLFVGLLFYRHLNFVIDTVSHSFVDTALNFPFPCCK